MAAPKWKTPKGNLGTIQEQEYYELSLNAIVPDDSNPTLTYKIIAGALPPGLVLNETTGTISGRSKDQYRLSGVPFNVSEDVTSTFCCRVTNTKTNQVSDRTFSLTVTGQDAPTIINDVEELGTILDGTFAEFQVTAIDLDVEPLTYYITNGELPEGMSLNKNTGIISGLVQPPGFLDFDATVGWSPEGAGWDEFPWQFYSRTISKRYIFDINVTDGKDIVSKKFSIYVISKNSLTADNDEVRVNGYYDIVTADLDAKRNPVMTSFEYDIGVYSHDNYFAYQFKSVDFDNDEVSYSILLTENVGFDNETSGFDTILFDTGDLSLPEGLTLSTETGWLYGRLPQMTGIQQEYQFAIFAYKTNYPEYKSPLKNYMMTVVGDMRNVITWVSPTDLGTVVAGNPCELAIEAISTQNKSLVYSLKVGSKSRLPQGLTLIDNGLISGRPSFEVTSFDNSKLTFDKTIRIGDQLLPETTFDREYTFTIKANDVDNTLIAYKTFKIKVLSEYTRPYESLYLRAQPGLEDKELYNQVIYNTDIIPNEYVYRLGDPYYGKQSNLEVLVLSGINPSEPHEYIEAMVINHYRKKLLIGEPRIARALDKNGNVKYEVLYLPMKDDNGSAAKSIDLTQKIKRHITTDRTYPSMDLTYFTVDGYDKIVYPNALRSMRQQIRDSLGYVDREVLPDWMTSKQEDGHIPYWTPALVLAYLKPGTGKKVKFLLDRVFEYDLKDLSFEVDRYVWDCNLSAVYNANTDQYKPSNATTFDSEVKIEADPIIFNFVGNGETTSFDLTTKSADLDADVGNDAAVAFTLNVISELDAVEYTVSGVDEDAVADVTFTDVENNNITVTDLVNGTYTVNLATFVDGIITATIATRDTAGNIAIGANDTALGETIKCIICSDVIDTNYPKVDGIQPTGVAIDPNAYVSKKFTVVDYEARQIHQFFATQDEKMYCITLDADTLVELFRSESVPISTIYPGYSYSLDGPADMIDRLVKLPGTNWVMMTIWIEVKGVYHAPGMSYLTYNVVTGALNMYDPSTYPVSDDYYYGPTIQQTSNGSNESSMRWAMPLGTNSGKTLACGKVTYDSTWNDFIDKAGYTLFIVDNTTGAMNCIAYGDFGDRKSHSQAWAETAMGDSCPTVVGTDYSEFVYYAPRWYQNIPEDKWGDKNWFYANTNGNTTYVDQYGEYKAYFYKVRVTTDGTITWNYINMMEDTTVPDFSTLTMPLYQAAYINQVRIANGYQSGGGGDVPSLTFYNAQTNEVNVVVPFSEEEIVKYPTFYYVYYNRSINGVALFKMNIDTGVWTRNDIDCSTLPWFSGNYWNRYFNTPYPTVNNMSEPKILVGKMDMTNTNSDMNLGTVSPTYSVDDFKTYVLDCSDGTVEPWVLDTTAEQYVPAGPPVSYTNWYGYGISNIVQNGFIDIPRCRLYFVDWYWDEYPTVPYGKTNLIQYLKGPKKKVDVQYIAVKVRWPSGTLPPDTITYTNIDQTVCTQPNISYSSSTSVIQYATGITDRYATGGNIQIEIDSTSIRLWNEETQTWVEDTSNQVSHASGVLSKTVDYFATHSVAAEHARFSGYGFNMDFTVPDSTQHFMTGKPWVEIVAAPASNTPVCLIDYNNPGTYDRVAKYDSFGNYTTSQSAANGISYQLTNNDVNFPTQIMYNGHLATVVGNAPEPTTTYYTNGALPSNYETIRYAYRTPQYVWLLLKTEIQTTKNDTCSLPTPLAPLVKGPWNPPIVAASYAVINISSREGHKFDILAQFLEWPDTDFYNNGATVPASNYVGQDSASFGNTLGNDIYIGSVRVGRWAGNSIDDRETLYLDMNALRSVGYGTDYYNTQYSAPKLDLRAKFIDQNTDIYLLVDVRAYSGGQLDPVTLEPIVEGSLLNAAVFETPVTIMDASPNLGEYIAQVRVTTTDGSITTRYAVIAAQTIALTDGLVLSHVTNCAVGAPSTTTRPAGTTETYISNMIFSWYGGRFTGYKGNSSDMLGNKPSNSGTHYVLKNGQWSAPDQYTYYSMQFEAPNDYSNISSTAITIPGTDAWTVVMGNQYANGSYAYSSRVQPVTGTDITYNITKSVPGDTNKIFKNLSGANLVSELVAYPTNSPFCWNNSGTKHIVSSYGDWSAIPSVTHNLGAVIGTKVYLNYNAIEAKILGVVDEATASTYTHPTYGGTPINFPRNIWLLLRVEPDPI